MQPFVVFCNCSAGTFDTKTASDCFSMSAIPRSAAALKVQKNKYDGKHQRCDAAALCKTNPEAVCVLRMIILNGGPQMPDK